MNRHIGPNSESEQKMLGSLGMDSLEQLMDETVPESIRLNQPLKVPPAISEQEYAKHIQELLTTTNRLGALLAKGIIRPTHLQ